MKITYDYIGNSVFTNASYKDEDGSPLYSRFGEYKTAAQVQAYLEWARKNDRNAR